jgi:hypothetical protein
MHGRMVPGSRFIVWSNSWQPWKLLRYAKGLFLGK